MKIPAVVLAAGLSSRMGRAKALLPLGGSTFLQQLVGTLQQACEPIVVVLGKDAEEIRASLSESQPNVIVAINPNYELGMLSSLQVGLSALPADSEGALFTLVDHPRVSVQTVQTLCDRAARRRPQVAIPRYRSQRGHPVFVSSEVIRELRETPPEGSPKDVIRRHRSQTAFIDLDDPAIVEDIDTREDYGRIADEGRD